MSAFWNLRILDPVYRNMKMIDQSKNELLRDSFLLLNCCQCFGAVLNGLALNNPTTPVFWSDWDGGMT